MSNLDELIRTHKQRCKKLMKSENEFEACEGRIHHSLGEPMLRWMDSEGQRGTDDIVQQAALMQFMVTYFTHLLFWLYGPTAIDEVILKDYANAIVSMMRDNATKLLNTETVEAVE